MTIKLLYFTADWCSPCKRFYPIVEVHAAKRGIELERHDIDREPGSLVAQRFDVRSVPTVIAVDSRGILLDRFGVLTPTALRDRLDKLA